jgi:hypothetical protein
MNDSFEAFFQGGGHFCHFCHPKPVLKLKFFSFSLTCILKLLVLHTDRLALTNMNFISIRLNHPIRFFLPIKMNVIVVVLAKVFRSVSPRPGQLSAFDSLSWHCAFPWSSTDANFSVSEEKQQMIMVLCHFEGLDETT